MRAAALLAAMVAMTAQAAREPAIAGKAVSAWVKELGKSDAAKFAAVTALMKAGPEARAAAPGLVKLLSAAGALRILAPLALSRIGPDAVPALRAALKDTSPNVRAGAALALGLIGPAARAAGPDLVDLVGDRDGIVRRNAVTALGLIGVRATQAITKALGDKDAAVAVEAAWSLAQGGDAAGAGVLARACASADEALALRAVKTLGELGARARAGKALVAATKHKAIAVRLASAVALSAGDPATAFAVVEAAMKDKEMHTRAIAALGQFAASEKAIGVLAAALADPAAPVRREAAAALAGSPGDIAPARKALLAGLLDADSATRWWCATALLGRPGDIRRDEDALLGAFRLGTRPARRMEAVQDIVGYERIGPALARVLETRPGRYQAAAARAAGFAGADARPAREALLKLLGDNDKAARRAAAEAMPALGLDALPQLTKALGDGSARVRESAARAMAFIGLPARQASKRLAGLLRDVDSAVRTQAALALWRIEGESETPLFVLELVIKDVDNADRWEAVEAVGMIASEARPPIRGLTEILVNGLKDRDARVRATATRWLWRRTRDGKNVLPLLRDAAEGRDEFARLVAVETLGELKVEAGPGPLLAAALADRSVTIRLAAQEGAAQVGDLKSLLKALGSKGKARDGAIRALGLMGPGAKTALPALARIGTPLARWALGQTFPGKEAALAAFLKAVESKASADELAKRARELQGK